MPGKTGAPHELPYPVQGDNPPHAEGSVKPLAERLHERLDEIDTSQLVVPGGTGDDGKLLIVKDGAAAYAAMKGDATIAEDGTLAIGVKKIVTEMLADLGVTTGKLANTSVTTAKLADAAVEAAKIKDLNVTTGKIADLGVTSPKLKPTYGEKISSAEYTADENPGFVPGMTLEVKPTVNSVLLLWHLWRVRFNKIQTSVSAVMYKNYGVPGKEDSEQLDIPSEQATLDINIPAMGFASFSIPANENAVIQPRVFGAGAKTTIPVTGGRYMYLLLAA